MQASGDLLKFIMIGMVATLAPMLLLVEAAIFVWRQPIRPPMRASSGVLRSLQTAICAFVPP